MFEDGYFDYFFFDIVLNFLDILIYVSCYWLLIF